MKLRSAPLDDMWGELTLVLDDDGRPLARVTRRVFTSAYRVFKAAMLVALRFRWRRSTLDGYPEPGSEPFNLSDAELEREWRQNFTTTRFETREKKGLRK